MRSVCPRCRRPTSACFCALLPSLPSQTRLVFLQHPRERRVAVGTAGLAHLSLPNSEFHVGVDFSDSARVRELAQRDDVAVLFPGEGALSPQEAKANGLKTLVVLDGTWTLAKKLLKVNPVLQTLPRVGFTPRKPGNYRIRKEPAEHCLSTIEAVVEVLGLLEGTPDAYQPMLRGFDAMVDHQIEHTQRTGGSNSRYLIHKGPPRPRVPLALAERWEDVLLLYAEANSQARELEPQRMPELIHWVAERPGTGERFEALVQHRNPLGDNTSVHLELPRERFLDAEPLDAAKARFAAFRRPTDLWATWGGHGLSLLKAEEVLAGELLDVRLIASRFLRGRAGNLDELAARWGGPLPAWGQGRAGRRLASLARVMAHLRAALQPSPERPFASLGHPHRGVRHGVESARQRGETTVRVFHTRCRVTSSVA